MEQGPGLIHPLTFEAGREYIWLERGANGDRKMTVQFAAYDPCPIFVIVAAHSGRRWRCLREELYFESVIEGKWPLNRRIIQ